MQDFELRKKILFEAEMKKVEVVFKVVGLENFTKQEKLTYIE